MYFFNFTPQHYPFLHPINAVYPAIPFNSVLTRPAGWIPYPQPAPPFIRNETMPAAKAACVSKAELELNQMFRMLWEQHVAWTRMLIISIAAGLPDEEFVTERLLRNPSDMGAIFKRYYEDEKAERFSNLMRDHLVLAAELVKAAKAGNSELAEETEKKWYDNADQIAAFMNSINPYWSKEELQKMLHEHLRMTKEEAVLRLSGKYKSDIEEYDKIEQQALEMADAFTAGIVKQFPSLFAS